MSNAEFCKFVPDDPSCVVEETPVDQADPPVENQVVDDVDKEIDADMERRMMEAQVTFLLTALSLTVHAALAQFRYRAGSTYYAAGDALSTNWWQHLNTAWNLFTIGFMGTATVTQLLSMLGIAAEVNVMVWMYGSLINTGFGLLTGLIAAYAYDAYW